VIEPSKAKIAVIGAGLMGHGIAQVFALAGHDVTITDTVVQNLDTAKTRIAANLRDLGDDASAVERVTPCFDLADAVREADYVVEAILENLALKQKLFAEIERHVRPDTILASNTSVIPITAIVQGLQRRERALGTHWWNPPFLVSLVEVIETQWTSADAIAWTMALHQAAGQSVASLRGPVAEALIGDLVAQVRQSQSAEKAMRKLLTTAFADLPASGHVQVVTIPGIGAATAAVLVAKIVDIDHFTTPDQVVGYFGVFPEENRSGVDKQGNPLPPGTLFLSRKGNDLVLKSESTRGT